MCALFAYVILMLFVAIKKEQRATYDNFLQPKS
jgi:hypothetical protein